MSAPKNIKHLLLLASSVVTYASHDPFDISTLSFDEQMRYATALSSGVSKEKAFTEATGIRAGYRKDKKSQEQEEAASLELIAAMQIAEQGGGGRFGQSPTIYKVRSHAKVAAHRQTLDPIVELLKKVQQGANVHDLDAHVAANIATIHVIGGDFAIDSSNFTVAEIKGYLEGFLKQNPDFYKGYEATAVTHPQLLGYIDAALATASQDASTLQMYSRVASLIQIMEKEGMDTRTYMQHFFDAVSENYLTQGGCFAGVRNRAYVRYVSMLYSLMG